MDKSQALLILKIDLLQDIDSDLFYDAVADAVSFEATFFMRRSFIPRLVLKRIGKLDLIGQAAEILGVKITDQNNDLSNYKELESYDELKALIIGFHQRVSEIKRSLSTCADPETAIALYRQWIANFERYSRHYFFLFDQLPLEDLPQALDVKMAESIDFNRLFSEIDNGNYTNLVFREYNRLKLLVS